MKYKFSKALAALSVCSVLGLAGCGGFETKESDANTGGDSTASSENTDAGSAEGTPTAEKVYRVSFNQPDTHPQFVALSNMGKRMAEATDGKCTLEVAPNETLGDQKTSIELVQAGTLDFAMVGGPLMENFNPEFVVFNLPYVFDSADHQKKVLSDSELTDELFNSVKDQDMQVLAGFHGGIRNVYNSKHPVNTPEDLKGMKIRVIESDTNLEMMKLMGGSGTPMSQGEVYTAIQSGVIDGGENNESIFANLKHDEIAPYYSYTRHLMFPDYLITNPKVLDEMDPACADFLKSDMENTVEEENKLWKEEIERSIASAKESGAEFNEVDTEVFREAVAPLVEQKLTTDFTKGLYEKVRDAAK